MVLLYAPGFTNAAYAQPEWTANQHTWLGWDGSEWDLSHGLSGLALQAGTRGLQDPGALHYRTKKAGIDGSEWRGSITDERACFWPIKVMADGGSKAWIQHYNAFWKTMRPSKTGQWVVTSPAGTRRTLTVRFDSLDDGSDDIDASLVGWALYGINLTAENPFWMGEPVTRTFTNATGQTFYGGDSGGGYGPPYYLSPSITTDTATITNPGDEDRSPVITILGPSTDVAVGVGGKTVAFPMDLIDGQWVRIDTDPSDRIARNQDGVDVTKQLSQVGFPRIPAGENVPIDIAMTGAGSVEVSLTPAYRRAV